MRIGAIILCGGKSSRMGHDKAMLSFGPELMLKRVVRLVGEVVAAKKIVVVAAMGQPLPELPPEVLVARDARPGKGPLEGLAAGLRCLQDHADAVFATSCDVPLLVPALIQKLFDLTAENEIVVPRDGDFYHPLPAVYRTSVLPTVQRMLKEDCRRMTDLLQQCATLEVPMDELRSCDPELVSFINCNETADYHRALRQAGF